jgi:transposase
MSPSATTIKQRPAHRRHDIDDHHWSLLEPLLPGRKGTWGGIAHDNRAFINAVFWKRFLFERLRFQFRHSRMFLAGIQCLRFS